MGTLYSDKPRKRWKEAKKIIDETKSINGHKTVEFRVLGIKPFVNLNEEQMRNFYNECNLYLAPTELEGFHNIPAEAALCNCSVICSRRGRNGMGDYANAQTAMIYDTVGQAVEHIYNPDYARVYKMQEILMDKIGTRKRNMAKMLEAFQK